MPTRQRKPRFRIGLFEPKDDQPGATSLREAMDLSPLRAAYRRELGYAETDAKLLIMRQIDDEPPPGDDPEDPDGPGPAYALTVVWLGPTLPGMGNWEPCHDWSDVLGELHHRLAKGSEASVWWPLPDYPLVEVLGGKWVYPMGYEKRKRT